jgi:hypothetical protein
MTRFFAAATVACALVAACTEPPPPDDEYDSLPQDVFATGTLTPDNTGIVHLVGGGKSCTGYLATNRWVITARHCVVNLNASDLSVKMGSSSSTATRIELFPSIETDVALVKLSSAMPMFGFSFGHHIRWVPDLATSLKGEMFWCWGYGAHDETGVIDGVLRFTAGQIVSEVSSAKKLLMPPNQFGEQLAPGDSGGPCFRFNGEYAGTISNKTVDSQGQPVDAVTPTDDISGWAENIIAQSP